MQLIFFWKVVFLFRQRKNRKIQFAHQNSNQYTVIIISRWRCYSRMKSIEWNTGRKYNFIELLSNKMMHHNAIYMGYPLARRKNRRRALFIFLNNKTKYWNDKSITLSLECRFRVKTKRWMFVKILKFFKNFSVSFILVYSFRNIFSHHINSLVFPIWSHQQKLTDIFNKSWFELQVDHSTLYADKKCRNGFKSKSRKIDQIVDF
jgi:hypothetical protein